MQQYGNIYFACRPPTPSPDPGDWVKIHEITKCSNTVANNLPADPPTYPLPLTLGMRSLGRNWTFSEHGHVAYQIKWDHKM